MSQQSRYFLAALGLGFWLIIILLFIARQLIYRPEISPLLSPFVENALARLEHCSPDDYALVRAYAQSFAWIPQGASPGIEGRIYIGTAFIPIAGTRYDSGEFYLMLTIAHETWHLKQFSEGRNLIITREQFEREAFTYELQVLNRCANTMKNQDELNSLRRFIEDAIQNPFSVEFP